MPNLEYNREGRKRQYISITKHQRHTINNHSKWVDFQTETRTFDAADYGNHANMAVGDEEINDNEWCDDNGHLWGFIENFQPVGVDNEQFGFFPAPQNENDRWHGYPIVPFKGHNKYNISDSLIERWINEGFLDTDDITTLYRGKRI